MKKIPLIATVPGGAVEDKEVSDSEFRLLSVIHTRSDSDGCSESNASLGGILGATPATVRKRVERLMESGWLMEIPGKKRVLKVSHEKMEMLDVKEPDMNRKLFDKKNIRITETDINHLIALFLKYKINKNVCRNADLMSIFYSNPFNRDGAKKLIREFSMSKVENVLSRYAERMDEMYCPQLKSLADLYKKWDSVNKYIDKEEETRITVIE